MSDSTQEPRGFPAHSAPMPLDELVSQTPQQLAAFAHARWAATPVKTNAPPEGVPVTAWHARLACVGLDLPPLNALAACTWHEALTATDVAPFADPQPGSCRALLAGILVRTRRLLMKQGAWYESSPAPLTARLKRAAARAKRQAAAHGGGAAESARDFADYVNMVLPRSPLDRAKTVGLGLPTAQAAGAPSTGDGGASAGAGGGVGAGSGAGISEEEQPSPPLEEIEQPVATKPKGAWGPQPPVLEESATVAAAVAAEAAGESPSASPAKRYNILLVVTDQERYFKPGELPDDYVAALPARTSLQARGVTFCNHHINSSVCSSSRSVLYTGQHIQTTRVFDNVNYPWVDNLPRTIPTIGQLLRSKGYYSAYHGKWHLSRELATHNQDALPASALRQAMEAYGFNDYSGIGDVMGKCRGAWLNDDMIGSQTIQWLKRHGLAQNEAGTPWFCAVNLVNPHDVMFFNTDKPGEPVQADPKPVMALAPAPVSSLYQQKWGMKLPTTLEEPLEGSGRPTAHKEYVASMEALTGEIPPEHPWRYRKLTDFYLNCIQHSDKVLEGILAELDSLGMADDTIVIVTSDHGELAGAHGLVGKGPCAYREANHVPFIVAHPGIPATHGQSCHALTSHLDVVPTLLGLAGPLTSASATRMSKRLPGHDFSSLLRGASSADTHAVRDAALFCFNMLAFVDGDLFGSAQDFLNAGGRRQDLWMQGFTPNLRLRGAVRSVFDGRFKFARYFSPLEHHCPTSLDELLARNDVELFDLDDDPDEANNLATGITGMESKYAELLMSMNAKLNKLLADELPVPDDGRMLPNFTGTIDWGGANHFDV